MNEIGPLRSGQGAPLPGKPADGATREEAATRLRRFFAHDWSVGALVRFHTREKFLLLAHDRRTYDRLGALVAGSGAMTRDQLATRYQELFRSALEKTPTPGQEVNVLQHILGHFKKKLPREEREEILKAIDAYRSGAVSLEVPLGHLREQAHAHRNPYLSRQSYLAPGLR